MYVKKGKDDMNATPPPGSTCYRVASGHVDETENIYIYIYWNLSHATEMGILEM
jgi:hypothetical protein